MATLVGRVPAFPFFARQTDAAGEARGGFLAGTSGLVVALVLGAFLRLWQVNAVGYNTDEAIYAGQAASIADDPILKQFFPIFRSHPILFQAILSLPFRFGVVDLYGRLVAVAVGLLTIYATYLVGRTLYGPRTAALAAMLLAAMPYHVVVTRQVLLDGPMTLFSTLALYMLARYAGTQRVAWLCAAGACVGLTLLSKTNGIVILGGLYAFFALAPAVRVRLRDLALALVCLAVAVAPYPVAINLAGRTATGGQYLAWQLFRRPNHDWSFYLTNVPEAIGPAVVFAALVGLWVLRHQRSWRETLLISWAVVPALFFQLWPTKGFQYLLLLGPVFAVLAARTTTRWCTDPKLRLWRVHIGGPRLGILVAVVLCGSLASVSWGRIQPATSDSFTAGTGGVPGGREAGQWIRENVPEGAQMLAIGPSMANIIQFYGHRKAYGLSVSPNPLRRNPSYEAVNNPDRLIRDNQVQYVVWDSFSAIRTKFFSDGVLRYANKYHGRAVHTQSVTVTTPSGERVETPVLIIYEVRP